MTNPNPVLLVLLVAVTTACSVADSAARGDARGPLDGAARGGAAQGHTRGPLDGDSHRAARGGAAPKKSASRLMREQEGETFATLERLAKRASVRQRWRGKASYYADSLVGNLMASGAKYESGRPYAAHRTLPFGSLIRVVRVSTGESVVLRVMDRGPFGDRRRIVDVSRGAAERLDLLQAGVADVWVELLSESR